MSNPNQNTPGPEMNPNTQEMNIPESRDDMDVILTSIGLIWDTGLCADGVPEQEWVEHAAGAVSTDSMLLATFTATQWEAPEAAGVAAACAAVGNLLAAVADAGSDFFTSLTAHDHSELERAADAIHDVLGNVAYWSAATAEDASAARVAASAGTAASIVEGVPGDASSSEVAGGEPGQRCG